jgi:hypothetical protein
MMAPPPMQADSHAGRSIASPRVVRRHWFPVLALVVALTLNPAVSAQAPFDTALVRVGTLASLVRAATVGDSLANFRSTALPTHQLFERLLDRLGRPEVHMIPLSVFANRRAALGVVARSKRPNGLTAREAAALDTLARVMEEELPDALTPLIGRDSTSRILDPLDAFNYARRNASIATSLEKLDRFERKYGPDAPRLNGVEVLLNYGGQWLPGFSPGAEGWPSRFELVSSYSPTWLTIADERARAVSVAEIGLRSYIWRNGWGGAEGGLLRPGYVSIGLAVAGERDGAMESPLAGEERFGAFVGWGEAKVAFLGGPRSRLVITRQFQFVPFIF